MAQDLLDKQLVEAVLSARPRRTKAEIEEARLASKRPGKLDAPVAEADVAIEIDEDDDEDLEADLELGPTPEGLIEAEEEAEEVDVSVEGEAAGATLPVDAPAKLDAAELEEPTAEELEALSADMIEIGRAHV